MGKGLCVVGTDTDVGKTFVTAGITYMMKKHHHHIIPYKPVQSGGEIKEGKMISPDISFIKYVSNIDEPYEKMNTYCFKDAVSPHIAGEREAVIFDQKKVIEHYNQLVDTYDYTIVEGAGGIVVPLSRNYYLYDLIKALDTPVIVVARAGVGTINHTVLTTEFLKHVGVEIKGLVINNYTGTFYEADNLRMIKEKTGIENIMTLNRVDDASLDEIKRNYETCFKIETLLEWFE